MTVLLTLSNVTKQYAGHNVLSELALQIHDGECVIIRGSNGSGKSTLLRIISGLAAVSSGERLLRDNKLLIGYTPDRLSKLRMTSTEYLVHMGNISGVPRKELHARIKELHSFYHLEQSSKLKMTQFSKGMLQKVNIMQATLTVPDLLILDEPFSGLDKASIAYLLEALRDIQLQGTAIIAAVHDPLLANQLINRTLWLEHGKLVEKALETNESMCTIIYELSCIIDELHYHSLKTKFPNAIWKPQEHREMHITVKRNDYQAFLSEVVHRGIEIVSLQRKEIDL